MQRRLSAPFASRKEHRRHDLEWRDRGDERRHGYYLFVSFDHCCDSPWNYNIRVGRSTSVTGPYTDKAGTTMMQGGGTLLVAGNSTWQGPGHNAVIVTATGAYNVYHALNPSNQAASLRIAEMAWDADGWPVSAAP